MKHIKLFESFTSPDFTEDQAAIALIDMRDTVNELHEDHIDDVIEGLENALKMYDKENYQYVIDVIVSGGNQTKSEIKQDLNKIGDYIVRRYGTEKEMVLQAVQDASIRLPRILKEINA